MAHRRLLRLLGPMGLPKLPEPAGEGEESANSKAGLG